MLTQNKLNRVRHQLSQMTVENPKVTETRVLQRIQSEQRRNRRLARMSWAAAALVPLTVAALFVPWTLRSVSEKPPSLIQTAKLSTKQRTSSLSRVKVERLKLNAHFTWGGEVFRVISDYGSFVYPKEPTRLFLKHFDKEHDVIPLEVGIPHAGFEIMIPKLLPYGWTDIGDKLTYLPIKGFKNNRYLGTVGHLYKFQQVLKTQQGGILNVTETKEKFLSDVYEKHIGTHNRTIEDSIYARFPLKMNTVYLIEGMPNRQDNLYLLYRETKGTTIPSLKTGASDFNLVIDHLDPKLKSITQISIQGSTRTTLKDYFEVARSFQRATANS